MRNWSCGGIDEVAATTESGSSPLGIDRSTESARGRLAHEGLGKRWLTQTFGSVTGLLGSSF